MKIICTIRTNPEGTATITDLDYEGEPENNIQAAISNTMLRYMKAASDEIAQQSGNAEIIEGHGGGYEDIVAGMRARNGL